MVNTYNYKKVRHNVRSLDVITSSGTAERESLLHPDQEIRTTFTNISLLYQMSFARLRATAPWDNAVIIG